MKPTRAVLSALIALLLLPALECVYADSGPRNLDAILRQAFEADEQGGSTLAAVPIVGAADGEERIACWIGLEPGGVLPAGISGRSYGGLVAARVTRSELLQLVSAPGIRRIEAAQRCRTSLTESVPEILADVVHDGSGSPPTYSGYTGQNVVIGVVDTGVDLDHPDFWSGPDTRLLSVWDQTAPTINPPAAFGYGREWTPAEIEGGTATEQDDEGHGTHVLGTAGGNGAATGHAQPPYSYVGVAPGARLVVVKTDFYTTSIVDGVDYVFSRAQALGLPAVVNLSLGHQYGPHDGTETTDLAIDALVGPGRIVVAAAGNEQEAGIHAEALVAPGNSGDISLAVPAYSALPGGGNDFFLIDGYYTNGTTVNVTLQTPSGAIVGPVTPGNSLETNTVDGAVVIENDYTDPVTDDRNVFVQIWDQVAGTPPASGAWTLSFDNTSLLPAGASAQIDCWLYSHTIYAPPFPEFAQGMTAAKLVASPATADSAIAVAAYVTRKSWLSVDGNTYMYNPLPTIGSLAAFSNHGPRRDGVLKPDIAAPGMGIGSALSVDYAIADAWILADGVHFITQGTSMAAPHVTGLVALMLEAFGDLSHATALERLRVTARGDGDTGALPNPSWGAGKIDALAATTSPTPVAIEALEILRDRDAIRLRWSVPEDVIDLRFHVARLGGADAVDRGFEEAEIIADVGPGPEYSFVDVALLAFDEVAYWLVPIEAGRAQDPYGPYLARWADRPAALSLAPAAPNPFVASTLLRYEIPRRGKGSLEVIDAGGRQVATLMAGTLGAGTHTIRWDGQGDGGQPVPAGLYWIRGIWNGQTRTQKVIRLRGD